MIKRTLLVIEHSSGKLKTANLNALSAAQKLGSITALVAGSDIGSVVAQACALKVDKVIAVQNDSLKNQLAEFVAPVIAATVKSGGFSHVVSSHSTAMKNILPRVGALLDVSPIADVVEITSDDTFKRPIYAGNAIAEVKSHDPVKIISVRSTAFPAAEATGGSAAVEKSSVTPADSPTKWLEEALAKSDRPELGSAKIIISGGRGMQNGDNFKILYQLADKLGGAVGASRAAVDAGFVSNDLQIGQTGKIVAPQLYVAVGLSGAIQHLAGMKDSKTIVAINKDPEAPIFQVADYGLVQDLFTAVPELTKKI